MIQNEETLLGTYVLMCNNCKNTKLKVNPKASSMIVLFGSASFSKKNVSQSKPRHVAQFLHPSDNRVRCLFFSLTVVSV